MFLSGSIEGDERPLILASSSPYRRMLLSKLGLAFEVVAPGVDESRLPGETPQALARRLANAKADAVAASVRSALIVASDQVAVLGEEILGKPLDYSTARSQLLRASGQEIVFFTSLCLLDSESGRRQLDVVPYRVRMRVLTAALVARYLEKDQPFDCAGSFKSEGLGIALFETLSGEDPNALTGLPLIRLVSMMATEGVSIP